jgi:hypothetical protein
MKLMLMTTVLLCYVSYGVQVQLRNVGLLPACNLKVAVSSAGVALAAAAAAAAAKQQEPAAAGSSNVLQELLGKCTVRR